MGLFAYGQHWNICLNSNSATNQLLYSNAGPSSRTWVVTVEIALNGGDNTQNAYWVFQLFDGPDNDNLVLAQYSDGEIYYVGGEYFSSTLTASFADPMNLQIGISNSDPVSQCFNVYVTAFDY